MNFQNGQRLEKSTRCLRFILPILEILFVHLLKIIILFSNAIVKQVFDELGLQLNDELSGLQPEEGVTNGPTKSKAGPTAVGADTGPSMDSADADLEARLKNLRRD